MRADKLLILVIFVLAVAGVLAFQLLGNGVPVKAPVRQPVIPSSPREFLGVSLQLQSGWDGNPYETYIKEISDLGADTIGIVVTGHQDNASSTSIFIDDRKTPSARRLRELLNYCRLEDPKNGKRALKVIFTPIVLLANRKGDDWRGSIEPSSWDDWWKSYTGYVVRYAKLSQECGVEVFMVGSELLSTEPKADRWKKLIAEVRAVYKGRLGYSANWDHYKAISWWDQLDIIGMTTYHDLTDGKKPTIDLLRRNWQPIREKILKWQNANYPRHPILFTEVGWPNQVTCAQYPWDYYRSDKQPDPEAQANCFEAFFATWQDDSAVAGYLVWEWRNYPEQRTGPQDTSYVPCDKPAAKVIEKHYKAAVLKKQQTGQARKDDKAPTSRPAVQ